MIQLKHDSNKKAFHIIMTYHFFFYLSFSSGNKLSPRNSNELFALNIVFFFFFIINNIVLLFLCHTYIINNVDAHFGKEAQ